MKAARALRGIERQRDLADKLAPTGVPWTAVGEVERGDRSMSEIELSAFVKELRLPAAWFSEPESKLWGEREPSQLDRIEAALEKIETKLDAADPTQELGDSDQETG